VTIGKKIISAKPGDEFNIAELESHRVEAKDDTVQILEISYGNFEEEDIIRLEDAYGRVSS
jgi:mannose-1-phosphate guanylyltransferase/mannose-6-phosphate isomerase